MKLATYRRGDAAPRLGLVFAERGLLLDVAAWDAARGADNGAHGGAPAYQSMQALIDAGDGQASNPALERLRPLGPDQPAVKPHLHALDDLQLLAPLPRPLQIRDCSLSEAHVRNAPVGLATLVPAPPGAATSIPPSGQVPDVYRQLPIYYISNRMSVIGPDEAVRWPAYSATVDFELELGLILGQTIRDVKAADADRCIFGWTIFNDLSARDRQRHEMAGFLGPTKGKSFDQGNVLGPWIVTADELGDIETLNVEVRVNGETWARTQPRDNLHAARDVLAYISQSETLHAGEVIGLGTVGGCCGLEIGRLPTRGDLIELYVDRIGVLRNRILPD